MTKVKARMLVGLLKQSYSLFWVCECCYDKNPGMLIPNKCPSSNLSVILYHGLTHNGLRILHGRVEIQNFSSSVEKNFTKECSEQVKYFFNTRREISYLQAAM